MQNHQQNPQPLKSQSLLQQNNFSSILENNSTKREQEIQKILEDLDREFSHLLNEEIVVEASLIDAGFNKIKGATWDKWMKGAEDFLDKKSAQAYNATLRKFHNGFKHTLAAVVGSDKAKANSQAVRMARTNYTNFIKAINNVEKYNKEIAALVVRIGNLKGDEKLFISPDAKGFLKSIKAMQVRTTNQDIKDVCNLLLNKSKPRQVELNKAYIASKWMASEMYRPYRISTKEIDELLQNANGFGVYDAPIQKPEDTEEKKEKKKNDLITTHNYESNYPKDPKKFCDITVSNMYTYLERENRQGRVPDFQVKKWERELRSRQAKVQNDSVEVNQYDFENLLNEFVIESSFAYHLEKKFHTPIDIAKKKFNQSYDIKGAEKKRDEKRNANQRNQILYDEIKKAGEKISKASKRLISIDLFSRDKIKLKKDSIADNFKQLEEYEQKNCRRSNKDIYEHVLSSLDRIQGNMDHNIYIADEQYKGDLILPYKIALVHELNLQYYVFLTHMFDTFSQIASNAERFAKNEDRKNIIGEIRLYSISANSPFTDFIQQFSKNYTNELLHRSSGLHESEGFHRCFLEFTKINGAKEFHQTKKMMTRNLSHDDVYEPDENQTSSHGYKDLLKFISKNKDIFLNTDNPIAIRKEVENNEEFKQDLEELISHVSWHHHEPTDKHKKNIEQQHDNAGFAKESLERLTGNPKEAFLKNPKFFGHDDVERVLDELKRLSKSFEKSQAAFNGSSKSGFYYDADKKEFVSIDYENHSISKDKTLELINKLASSVFELINDIKRSNEELVKKAGQDKDLLASSIRRDEFLQKTLIAQLGQVIEKQNLNINTRFSSDEERKDDPLSPEFQEVLQKIYDSCLTEDEKKSLAGKQSIFTVGNSPNKKYIYSKTITNHSDLHEIPIFDTETKTTEKDKEKDKEKEEEEIEENFFQKEFFKFITEDDRRSEDIPVDTEKRRGERRDEQQKTQAEHIEFINGSLSSRYLSGFSSEVKGKTEGSERQIASSFFNVLDKFIKQNLPRENNASELKTRFFNIIISKGQFRKYFKNLVVSVRNLDQSLNDIKSIESEMIKYFNYQEQLDNTGLIKQDPQTIVKKIDEFRKKKYTNKAETSNYYYNMQKAENFLVLYLKKLLSESDDKSDRYKTLLKKLQVFSDQIMTKYLSHDDSIDKLEQNFDSGKYVKAVETIQNFRNKHIDVHRKPSIDFFKERLNNIAKMWNLRKKKIDPAKNRYTNTNLATRPKPEGQPEGQDDNNFLYFKELIDKHIPKTPDSGNNVTKIAPDEEEYVLEFLNNIIPSQSFTHDVVNAYRMDNEALQKYHVSIGKYMRDNKVSFRISLMKRAADEKDPEKESDEHLDEFYEKQAKDKKSKESDQSSKRVLTSKEREEKEFEDKEKEDQLDKKSLYNKRFQEIEETGHSYAEKYGKEIWNSVGKTTATSQIFRKLPNREQKVVAHQILLDLHKALGEAGRLNPVQQTKFSKDFLEHHKTFFQTKTKGFQSKGVQLKDDENDIWGSLKDITPNTSYGQLPQELQNKISKGTYNQAFRIVNKFASSEKMKSNQRKSFAHLITGLGTDLEQENLNYSAGQKNQIMSHFGKRVSQYAEHMLKEDTDYLKDERQLLKEAVASIRWRRNPRTHLNKVIMTCKTGQYKKSLNKDIKVAGQKVKEVMCLPVSSKPASQKAKDRKSSIKRWRKIKANPGKMTRSKLKRNLTKKYSKSLR